MFESILQVMSRLGDYQWWEVALELLVIWAIVYIVYRFVQGTRAAGALKGIVILIVAALGIRVVSQGDQFARLGYLFDRFLGFVAIAMVVVFQPELRRALIRLGETPVFRASQTDYAKVVSCIVDAATFLSRNKFGAIMAVERKVGLRETIETGRVLNADLSAHLLNSIFWPNSPLHDMGVVIRGSRITAAGVQFPLADAADMPDTQLGTRHRAAVGLARVSDAVVIVVSEETGAISIAEGRRLLRWLTPEALRAELLRLLSARTVGEPAAGPSEPVLDIEPLIGPPAPSGDPMRDELADSSVKPAMQPPRAVAGSARERADA